MNILCMLLFTRCGDFVTNTTEGPVSGYQMKSRSGRSFIAFSGIPYAAPPIGKLRFQDPQPPAKRNAIRETQFVGNFCLQSMHHVQIVSNAVIGSEDCLYLSIYTPRLNPRKPYPVLVYIHGGGFEFGMGEFTGRPGYFMDHNIVVVTLNYRLGLMGFLSMEDSVLSGNMGLKDQNMALKWIQRNIKNFGGDAKRVTIYGESAGGASVYYHMISPWSKGLFHQGISQSGTALTPWASSAPGVGRARAIKIAKMAGCPTKNTKSMLNCLQQLDGRDLMRLTKHFPMNQLEMRPTFTPIVDSAAKDPFLPEEPHKLKPLPVPWLTGCSNMEGIIKTAHFSKFPNHYNDMDSKFMDIFPTFLFNDNITVSKDVALKIRKYYFGNESITPAMTRNMTNMVTDSWFIWPMIKSLKRHSGPHYVYYNTYQGENTLQDIYAVYRIMNGTAHADELIYLWDFDMSLKLEGQDLKFSKFLVKLWVNFITYGKPTPDGFKFNWPQWDDVKQKYIKFSNRGIFQEEKLLAGRTQFWSSIMEK